MKQPPIEGAAVLKSVSDFENGSSTDFKITKPHPKDNIDIVGTAHNLATLYRTLTDGSQPSFIKIYEALTAEYDSDQRRPFYRVFREAVL
jgi:hypothetical protein